MEDERLRELALEVQRYPHQSEKRRLLLNSLLDAIFRHRSLGHPQIGLWPPHFYEDLRNEAISITLTEIAEKIDNYDPARGCVMAWVNKILNFRFLDVLKKYNSRGLTFIPTGRDQKTIQVMSLDELKRDLPMETADSDAERLRKFIEKDPEKLLQKHIKGRSKATMQFLLLARLDNQTWRGISEKLEPPPISDQALSSFFNRQLRNLDDYFANWI